MKPDCIMDVPKSFGNPPMGGSAAGGREESVGHLCPSPRLPWVGGLCL